MNTRDHDPLDDDRQDAAFDDYLRRDSAVSQYYRELDGGVVPPSLDRAVLAQARAATSATKRSRLLRWSAPMALAASVVVVVSLVMQPAVYQAVQQDVAQSLPQTAPNAERVPLESKAVSQGHAETEKETDSFVRIVPPSDLTNLPAPAIEAEEISDAPATKAEQSRAERASEQVSAEVSKRAAMNSRRTSAAPPPPQLQAPPVAPAATTAIRQTTSMSPMPMPVPKPEAIPQTPGNSGINAPAPASAEQRVDARTELEELVMTGSEVKRPPAQAAGPRGTVRASRAQSEVGSDAATAEANRESDPQQWLDYIRQLRRDGKVRAADREWDRYVARYPDDEVDADDLARPQR